ncbi:hypothetical protein [Paraburkholderia sp. Cy-641]|uniref:hypothetical protein n=1 Tax=Paraburkholderia sp. Cy-641 TaxID=2608337 RepID=UPI00141F4DDE|nr:hypothetical protein [Paraburkholderia sp. Cy-641]
MKTPIRRAIGIDRRVSLAGGLWNPVAVYLATSWLIPVLVATRWKTGHKLG